VPRPSAARTTEARSGARSGGMPEPTVPSGPDVVK
jgi:hypothetical protein